MLINKNIWGILTATLLLAACTEEKVIPPVTAPEVIVDKGWKFETTPTFEDNFDGSSVDANKWVFETGGSGWGNNELQNYTAGSNSSVASGIMTIEARRESSNGREYSSSRMLTRGKAEWLYGRFEIRAKLPKGRGTWPAIWMLSADNSYGNWPASGEIDIMEHVGYDPNRVHFSIHTSSYNHTRNTQRSTNKIIPNAMDDYNVYRLDWTPFAVRGFINGEQYFEFTNENKNFAVWPFDKKFFMILNIAVGGNWGGAQGVDNSIFPAKMMIDYVKVYKMIP